MHGYGKQHGELTNIIIYAYHVQSQERRLANSAMQYKI